VIWGLGLLAFGASGAGACSSKNGVALQEGGAANSGGETGNTPECESDSDCRDDEVCRSGSCSMACDSDKDCRATDQLCGDDDVCVDCLTDSHCDEGETCTAAGTCRGPGGGGNSGGAPSSSDGGEPNEPGEGGVGGSSGGTPGMGGTSGSGGSAGTSGSGGTDPGDCETEAINPCAGLPHFAGTQTVDGDDADFCAVSPFTLSLASTAYYRTPKPPLGSTTSASARVAWSAAALHVFIRVVDTTPHPNNQTLTYIWVGDNVEVFASPKAPTGTFNYARSYDYGAFQVIAGPPGGSYYPSGQAAFASTGYAAAVPASQINIAATATGYTVEAQIPWTDAAPVANVAMGFDMGLSDDVDGLNASLAAYRDYYGLLFNGNQLLGTCSQHAEPYCDSRNWCTPIALP
jgi:hypothetical protein